MKKYKTRNKSFFNVGDVIEDCMSGESMGLGLIVKKHLLDDTISYTKTNKTSGRKQLFEKHIREWKYLVMFPNPSKNGIMRSGKQWLWEIPMRNLIDDGSLKLHRAK